MLSRFFHFLETDERGQFLLFMSVPTFMLVVVSLSGGVPQ